MSSLDLQILLAKIDVTMYVAIAVYSPFLIFTAMALAEAHSKYNSIPLRRSYLISMIVVTGGLFAPVIVLYGNGRKPVISFDVAPLLVVLIFAPPLIAFTITALVFKYRKPKTNAKLKRVYSDEVEEIREWLWYAPLDLESLEEEVQRQKRDKDK